MFVCVCGVRVRFFVVEIFVSLFSFIICGPRCAYNFHRSTLGIVVDYIACCSFVYVDCLTAMQMDYIFFRFFEQNVPSNMRRARVIHTNLHPKGNT